MVREWLLSKRVFGRILNTICNRIGAEGITYSQNCEDLIIDSVLNKKRGIYVDVGAHHPIRFSNTLRLYLNGWNGINIDPLPGCMTLFKKYRPKDINLNVGISNSPGVIKYYNFKESPYNTISKQRAEFLINNGITELVSVKNIKVIRLQKVFDKYIKDKKIDLLTIDVESMELSVLQSNDWGKYRPRLIVMESIVSCHKSLETVKDDSAVNYLMKKGYMMVAKVNNAVFLLAEEEFDDKE